MKKIYLFTGLPGSGKSSVSKLLALKKQYPRVSKDDEQVTLFEKFGFNSNDEKRKLVKKADDLIFAKLSTFLKKNDSIVLDQWVRDREYIARLTDELGADVVLIYIYASPKVITIRFNGRSRPLCFDAKNIYPVINGLTEFWPETTIEKNEKAQQEYEGFLKTIVGAQIVKINSDNLSVNEETERIIDLLNEQ